MARSTSSNPTAPRRRRSAHGDASLPMPPPTDPMPTMAQTILEGFAASKHRLAEKPFHEWPTAQLPLERLYHAGVQTLSDIELLALFINESSADPNPLAAAERLVASANYSWMQLYRMGVDHMALFVGRHAAAQIVAAWEVQRRMHAEQLNQRQIRSPADAAQLLITEMAHLDQEHLKVVCLGTKNHVQKIHTVYVGSLNTSTVRIGELFKEAIRLNAATIIIAHNHPSGEPTPSPEDVAVTRQIVEAGRLLDIDVLDHLIIGQGRYVSLRERGLGFA